MLATVNMGNDYRFLGVVWIRQGHLRSEIWKSKLVFIGNHKYASTKQCYKRIRICSLHSTEDSYCNSEKSRLSHNDIPSLVSPLVKTNTTCLPSKAAIYTDAFVQTEASDQKHQYCQTSVKLLASKQHK